MTAPAALKVFSALFLLMSLPAEQRMYAADTNDWSNLNSLRRGQRIRIVQSDRKRIEGSFNASSDTAITLQSGQTITIPRDRIAGVYKRGRISRPLRALIGAGIGLTAGIIIDATAGQRFRNEGGDISAGAWGGGAALGAGIGALTGDGYRAVYQRRR